MLVKINKLFNLHNIKFNCVRDADPSYVINFNLPNNALNGAHAIYLAHVLLAIVKSSSKCMTEKHIINMKVNHTSMIPAIYKLSGIDITTIDDIFKYRFHESKEALLQCADPEIRLRLSKLFVSGKLAVTLHIMQKLIEQEKQYGANAITYLNTMNKYLMVMLGTTSNIILDCAYYDTGLNTKSDGLIFTAIDKKVYNLIGITTDGNINVTLKLYNSYDEIVDTSSTLIKLSDCVTPLVYIGMSSHEIKNDEFILTNSTKNNFNICLRIAFHLLVFSIPCLYILSPDLTLEYQQNFAKINKVKYSIWVLDNQKNVFIINNITQSETITEERHITHFFKKEIILNISN